MARAAVFGGPFDGAVMDVGSIDGKHRHFPGDDFSLVVEDGPTTGRKIYVYQVHPHYARMDFTGERIQIDITKEGGTDMGFKKHGVGEIVEGAGESEQAITTTATTEWSSADEQALDEEQG